MTDPIAIIQHHRISIRRMFLAGDGPPKAGFVSKATSVGEMPPSSARRILERASPPGRCSPTLHAVCLTPDPATWGSQRPRPVSTQDASSSAAAGVAKGSLRLRWG